MKHRIVIDLDVDRPFADAEQERYVLATIEEALESEVWFDMLANEDVAPQKFSKVCASFHPARRS